MGAFVSVFGAVLSSDGQLAYLSRLRQSPASMGVKKSAIASTHWGQAEHWFGVYPVVQTCWYWEVLG